MRVVEVGALACLFASATAAGAPQLSVTHGARSLQPGEAVLVTVESSEPVDRVIATTFTRRIVFFPNAARTRWRALVGIDLNVQPGPSPLRVTAAPAPPVDYLLSILPKSFPTRRLTLPNEFVNPPDAVRGRIEREASRLADIFGSVTEERLWRRAFQPPVAGPARSFGVRSILNGERRAPHGGADFPSPEGAPIRAPNGGRVVLAEALYFTGNTVVIDHGLGLYSLLAHLSAFSVRAGDRVGPGDRVGAVGSTGRVTGPHLHWAVRVNGARVDPLSLVAVSKELED